MNIKFTRFLSEMDNIETFYPYRTAIVFDTFFELELDPENDQVWNMIRKYLGINGYRPDNHICWKLKGKEIYFWLSDNRLAIGSGIRVGNY